MPKKIAPLSDVQVRNTKPKAKDIKMFDGQGLFLLVTRTGGKLWRMKYDFHGKEGLLTFGAYPAISLADARQRRDEAKKLLANGVDPKETKKALKAAQLDCNANSFEVVAREWHTKFSPTWSDSHAYWVLRRLEQYVFPAIFRDA